LDKGFGFYTKHKAPTFERQTLNLLQKLDVSFPTEFNDTTGLHAGSDSISAYQPDLKLGDTTGLHAGGRSISAYQRSTNFATQLVIGALRPEHAQEFKVEIDLPPA